MHIRSGEAGIGSLSVLDRPFSRIIDGIGRFFGLIAWRCMAVEHPGQMGAAIPVDLPRCGARLVSRNLWHSCARYRLEDLFARAERTRNWTAANHIGSTVLDGITFHPFEVPQ